MKVMKKKDKTTTIMVYENTWRKLHNLKQLGETMDELLKRLLKDR